MEVGGTLADYTCLSAVGSGYSCFMVRLNKVNASLLAASRWNKLNHDIIFSLKKTLHILPGERSTEWIKLSDVKDDNWASIFKSHNKASLAVFSPLWSSLNFASYHKCTPVWNSNMCFAFSFAKKCTVMERLQSQLWLMTTKVGLMGMLLRP